MGRFRKIHEIPDFPSSIPEVLGRKLSQSSGICEKLRKTRKVFLKVLFQGCQPRSRILKTNSKNNLLLPKNQDFLVCGFFRCFWSDFCSVMVFSISSGPNHDQMYGLEWIFNVPDQKCFKNTEKKSKTQKS